MKSNLLHSALALIVGVLIAESAVALPLCLEPLAADCFEPRWGVIEPEGLEASRAGSAAVADAAPSSVRLRMVAAHDDRSKGRANVSSASRIVIDDGRDFRNETRALTAAIKRASFDREGNLESGERAILAAAQALQRVAVNHQLNLYLRTPRKYSSRQFAVLARKVSAINRILVQAAGGETGSGGPKS